MNAPQPAAEPRLARIDALATDNLPASVREMIALVGLAPTLALVNAFPGQILCVPTGDKLNSQARLRLVALIGDQATAALTSNYGGQRLPIPRCAAAMRDIRDRQIIAAYGQGVRVAQLTADYLLTDRQIRSILKRTPGQTIGGLDTDQVRQLGLFEG